ncbi:MAG: hypothetical protein LBQ98_09600 [Nitrososphaerota archaeon]|jgi:hypothetical protein|nr:hypothetical protein [Nitrososphaerota archaeon]
MNLLKQTTVTLLTTVFSALIVLSTVLPLTIVSAQVNNYSITQVERQVQVMYSGNIVILDTIHVLGQISNSFTIGLPYQYSADVLKVLAYDKNHAYDMNRGVQIDGHSGFYGVEINFEGNTPSSFTVAFVLSNRLVTEDGNGGYIVDFPAYPSLTQSVETCNVNVMFPNSPTTITINKSDSVETSTSYVRTNLPAYTYSIAQAKVVLPAGTLQLAVINSLNRQITIDATGAVTTVDTYHITSSSASQLSAFVLSLPLEAENVVIRQYDEILSNRLTENSGMLLANVMLDTFVNQGETTSVTAKYNLPGVVLQNGKYILRDFEVFPDLRYFVGQAVAVFSFPEGASLVLPQVSLLDVSATLTRNAFQDIFTIKTEGVSYVDHLAHQQNIVEMGYRYSPVWVSFRPTFLASLVALIGCVGAVVYRVHKSKEETYENRAGEIFTALKPTVFQPGDDVTLGQPITVDTIRYFVDTYEAKKHLLAELKRLDVKAQKGKIPRRQYKVQKKTIETHMESLTRNIERSKVLIRNASDVYTDLIIQLELAEADLTESEKNIENLETLYDKGEISRENYKQNIVDCQKIHDKAESAIKGIMLKLREKIRRPT